MIAADLFSFSYAVDPHDRRAGCGWFGIRLNYKDSIKMSDPNPSFTVLDQAADSVGAGKICVESYPAVRPTPHEPARGDHPQASVPAWDNSRDTKLRCGGRRQIDRK